MNSIAKTQENRKRELVQKICPLIFTFTHGICDHRHGHIHIHKQLKDKTKFANFSLNASWSPLIGVIRKWRSLRHINRTSGIRWSRHSDGRKDQQTKMKVFAVYTSEQGYGIVTYRLSRRQDYYGELNR